MKPLLRQLCAAFAVCFVLSSVVPEIRAQSDTDNRLADLARQVDALKVSIESLRQTPSAPAAAATNPPATPTASSDPIARIRDEALNRSKLMETLSYLTEVIGPRLTASPNIRRGSTWTRDQLTSWGLVDARLEPWGPFGRGWSVKRFSAQVLEPYAFPLIGYPRAWSPGLAHETVAEIVHIDARTEADLEKYRGKLKDAIVLISPVRELTARFQPLAVRASDTALLNMANAPVPAGRRGGAAPARGGPAAAAPITPAPTATGTPSTADGVASLPSPETTETPAPTNPPARAGGGQPVGRGQPAGRGAAAAAPTAGRILTLLIEEGAALAVTSSTTGDGGTVFLAQVTAPGAARRGGAAAPGTPAPPTYYSATPPQNLPQMTLAVEDYNRLVRMTQRGEKVRMAVDLQVEFHADDLMSHNIVAEIPGTDLQEQVVMLGGHFDSWHAGTGATDNAAGVAVALEAVRIIKLLDLKPRRTIRIALWSGEEQGLLGSAAYVRSHFGYFETPPPADAGAARGAGTAGPAAPRRLVKLDEYDRLSAYFNLDNGTGKIRGIYAQGNEAVRPIFRQWLQPFSDLGASTVTLSNTGSTDHASFDNIGLPGFQFIQDTIEYNSRTHHSNADVLERIQAEDLKQAAAIMAAFVYNTAMRDEKLPRKNVE